MYGNLRTDIEKKIASECFIISYKLLESWLNKFTYVRNTCAHYGRIYNKTFKIRAQIHNKYKEYELKSQDRIFITILAIKEFMISKTEWNDFFVDLKK